MKNNLFGLGFVVYGCFVTRLVLADVLYDTFGPDDSYDLSGAFSSTWNVVPTDPRVSTGLGSAARFQVAGGSYRLNSITLAMGYTLGTNNLAVSIVADNGGLPTGGLLETVAIHPANITSYAQVVTFPSSLEPVMVAGGAYWIMVEPADQNPASATNNGAFNWWLGHDHPLGIAGTREFNFGSQVWNPWQVLPNNLLPAFRIEGTLVPEPSTVWLVFGGLGWLGFCSWRKRRG